MNKYLHIVNYQYEEWRWHLYAALYQLWERQMDNKLHTIIIFVLLLISSYGRTFKIFWKYNSYNTDTLVDIVDIVV